MKLRLAPLLILIIGLFTGMNSVHGQVQIIFEVEQQERVCHPHCLASLAQPSVTRFDGLGYVGGGKVMGGECRGAQDGTFGMDYVGFGWFRPRNFLNWSHDRRHQPGPGKYVTDGPKVPDVVANNPVKLAVKALTHQEK